MYIIIYSEWILVLISDGCVQSELTNQHWPPNLLITKLKDWWQHLIFEWVQIISNWVSSHRHQKLALLKRKQKDFPESWCHPAPEIGPAVEFFKDFFFCCSTDASRTRRQRCRVSKSRWMLQMKQTHQTESPIHLLPSWLGNLTVLPATVNFCP